MILKKPDGRLWEIDVFRAVAVILMIFFHLLYDLHFFEVIQWKIWSGYSIRIASCIASIFFILVGMCLTISYSKSKQTLSENQIRIKFIKRGLKTFLLGMIITALFLIVIPERSIIFGVLHCIGVSIILSIPFLKYRLPNIVLGIILVGLGLFLKGFTFDFAWLLPFGFMPHVYVTSDYFPLLPWFGVLLIGIAIGNLLYPEGQRRYKIADFSKNRVVSSFCFIGRHSLLIYFLHQPILLGIIFLLFLNQ